ncbi:MAG: hypothetical protein VR75_06170 [Hyphomonadaceae bacterium BRH_c29]|nr:MAG: hypothetical protein VR75_06170 [Hyphomonadaceae bacterium BRH_c29]
MDAPLRKLTLVCPKSVEPTVLDTLDAMLPELPGYTCNDGLGRGSSMELASTAEKVKGAMRIFTVIIVLPEEGIERILDAVKCACPRRQISFWIEPVLDFGRLK